MQNPLRLISALLLFACALQAQDTTFLNPVVVSAKLENDSLNNLDRQVHTVGYLEIQKNQVHSIEHILEHRPALDLRQRGAWDIQGDLQLRAGTFNQNSILIDGIPMNDPQTGHHNLNLPVQSTDLESVEILYGGGSRVSGEGSFSGAVNFITRLPVEESATIGLVGGMYGLMGADLDWGGKRTKIGLHYLRSDGYIKNTDFNQIRVFAGKSFLLKEAEIKLTTGYQAKGFGAQDFYTARYPYQYEQTKSFYVNGSYSNIEQDIQLKLSWRRHWDRFELFREDEGYWQYQDGYFVDSDGDTASYAPGVPGWEYPGHNYHRSDAIYAHLSKGFSSKYGRTKIAVSHRREGIVSNVLGDQKIDPIVAGDGRGSYSKKAVRSNYSLFGEHNFSIQKLDVSIGLIFNSNTAFESGWYPGIDLGYRLGKNSRLFASYNRSFRLPTYTELFYTIGGAQGSADLEQEISDNYELGGRFFGDSYRISGSVFRREGQNMIDWIYENDTAWARNITEVDMNGLEASFDYMPRKSFAGLDMVRLGYTLAVSEQDDNSIQSLYVFDYLKHKAYLFVNHQFSEKLNIHYQLSLQKRAGNYEDFSSGAIVNYSAFLLMDVGFQYQIQSFSIDLGAKNLFNADYVDRPNVVQPGIWIHGGISYKIK